MTAQRCVETSGIEYPVRCRYVAEGRGPERNRCENLKTRKYNFICNSLG